MKFIPRMADTLNEQAKENTIDALLRCSYVGDNK